MRTAAVVLNTLIGDVLHARPVTSIQLHHHDGLRSVLPSGLLTEMPAPKPRKRLRPRGFFGRWKWVLISILVLLLIPALQVAVVRFINPPVTLPMLIEKAGAMFSSRPERPLLYHWID